MSLSSKFLSPEDLSNGLDIVGQSSLRFNNSKAGLQSDMPEDISESAEKLKLEIEIDLSEIKNVSAEIEIELKLANTVNASIEADKEALAKEAINRDVVDYSINSFNNQMLAERRGDMLVSAPEVSGMQGVASMTIADGLRYVVENKKELFQKALEKLQKLFAYLIKKIKEYYRKGFYALHRFIHMPNRLAERLNNLPDGVLNLLITPNMLSDKTKDNIEGAFSIFSFLNIDDSKKENTFSLVDKLDRLRLGQVFSNQMFLDIEHASKDGILKTRDVELLKILSNKEIIKKYFAYTVPSGFSIDNDVIFAIAFNTNASTGKISNVTLGISKTNFYTEDSLDLSQSTTVTFDATLKPSLSADVVITLGSISDLSAIGKILETFDGSTVKSIEDSQNRGLNMLEKKVNSLNVADKDMQIKFKTYKGIYDVLNVVAMSNLVGLVNCYARVSKSLENVVDEVIAHEKAKEAAGVQSDSKSKAELQTNSTGA